MRYPNLKTEIRNTRDLMIRAGVRTRDIDRFLAEVNRSTPAVIRSLCREWRARLEPATLEAPPPPDADQAIDECDEDCMSCPTHIFIACVTAG